jgi:hypothetical protein
MPRRRASLLPMFAVLLLACEQRLPSDPSSPSESPTFAATRVSIGESVPEVARNRIRHFVSWNAQAEAVNSRALLPLPRDARFVLVMAIDAAGDVVLAARVTPGMATSLDAASTAFALLAGVDATAAPAVTSLTNAINVALATGTSLTKSTDVEGALHHAAAHGTAFTRNSLDATAAVPVSISSSEPDKVEVENSGLAYYKATAYGVPTNAQLATDVVPPSSARTLSLSNSRIRIEAGLSWPDNAPRLLRIGVEVLVFTGLNLPNGTPEQLLVSCATTALLTSSAGTLEKAAQTGEALALAEAIVKAAQRSQKDLSACMLAYSGAAGGALLGRAAIGQFFKVLMSAYSAAQILLYDGPFIVEVARSAAGGPLTQYVCRQADGTYELVSPEECNARVELAGPQTMIGSRIPNATRSGILFDQILQCTLNVTMTSTGNRRAYIREWNRAIHLIPSGALHTENLPQPLIPTWGFVDQLDAGESATVAFPGDMVFWIGSGGTAPQFRMTVNVWYSAEPDGELQKASFSSDCL